MVKQTAALFKNRRTTQDFLYSQSEETVDAALSDDAAATGLDAGNASLVDRIPDLLDRETLIDAVETRMQDASRLCVIAVEIDTRATPSDATAAMSEALAPLAAVGHGHGGILGRIAPHRFALAVAGYGMDDAMSLARSLLAHPPDSEAPPVTLGIAVYPTLDDSRAQTIANADKALDHGAFFGPGSITAFDATSLNISGDHHYQTGDIQGAIRDFEKGLALDPSEVNLHNSLGVCYGVLKDYPRAFRAFDQAIALAPDNVMPVYNKGYLLLLQGKREEALACFLDAQAKEPDIFEVVFHIGQTLMEMGDAEQAEAYLAAALQANSRSGPAHRLMGDCLTERGLIRKAIQTYKKAVKINPEDADSLSALGWLYSRIEESLDVAAVLCTQSIHLNPDEGLFHHRLAEVFIKQARLDAAVNEFETALALGYDSQARITALREQMTGVKAS
jgi:tetratricopeptide (TPR) repeat protein